MAILLEAATRALGELNVVTEFLPNPGLFIQMYVRKEATLSSQIEGTQASMLDLLEYEAKGPQTSETDDVREIANYVRAMNMGLERLTELPISNRYPRPGGRLGTFPAELK